MSGYSMRHLMGDMIYEMFYRLFSQTAEDGKVHRGLTWSEDGWGDSKGHYKALAIGFRKDGLSLTMLCYAPMNPPAVLVHWGSAFANVNEIRDWKLLSYHDASFSDSVSKVLGAVDELDISILDNIGSGIQILELTPETREHIKENNLRRYTESPNFLLGEKSKDYLMGRHLDFKALK